MASEERFGYEWDRYSKILPEYETQFINWVKPFVKTDFKNKTIFDAGCGMGRNSYFVLKYGAKSVFAIDNNSKTIEAAKNNLKEFKNATVEEMNINNINLAAEYDIVMSIGVVHHLDNPNLAIRNFKKLLRPGGKLLVWVYSFEGNEWIENYISPIRRKVTSKLPISLLHFLSYFICVPLFIYVKCFSMKNMYLRQISDFSFRHINSIIFDQLLPRVAFYWTEKECRFLFKDNGFKNVNIYRPDNNQGWTIIAENKD